MPSRLATLLTPYYMSWLERTFQDYLRLRDRIYPRSLAAVRCPSRAGLVSVVLPVFNGARYLGEAIDSILAQTWRDFELIVVDDGSTDDSAAIAEEAAARDPRARVIRQPNRKLPGALNVGFAAARGEFLTWTSCDNRLRPRFLEAMVAALRRRPDVDMVYADYDLIDEEGHPARNADYWPRLQHPPGSGHVRPDREIGQLSLSGGNPIGPAFLYRDRVRYLVGDYSPRRFTIEDFDYFLRINGYLNSRHAGFAEAHYEYRIHGGSLTATGAELGIDDKARELLSFDAARRERLFAPMIWEILIDASAGERARECAGAFRRRAERGATIADKCRAHPGSKGLTPEVGRVWFTDRAGAALEPPPSSLAAVERGGDILVYTGRESPPAEAHEGWMMCVATESHAEMSALAGDRRGWLRTGEADALWTLLALRLKADAAMRLEAEMFETGSRTPAARHGAASENHEPPPREGFKVRFCWRRSQLQRERLRHSDRRMTFGGLLAAGFMNLWAACAPGGRRKPRVLALADALGCWANTASYAWIQLRRFRPPSA